MQEDKTSKWLADQLRKQQEEDQLPYELGAWEAFESKRVAIAGKKSNYWISGVAAAVALLLVAGGSWLILKTGDVGTQLSEQIALEEKSVAFPLQETAPAVTETPELKEALSAASEEKQEKKNSLSSSTTRSPDQSGLKSSDQSASKAIAEATPKAVDKAVAKSIDQTASKPVDQTTPKPTELAVTKPDVQPLVKPDVVFKEVKPTENLAVSEKPVEEKNAPKITTPETLAAVREKIETGEVTSPTTQKSEIAQTGLSKDPQLSDEEIKEILDKKSFASIGMGVSPGFGASQSSEKATSGASVGLGVMVDMAITGKLVMGSGVAVNYLNQASESQSYNYAGFGAASTTVTEKDEIAQVQVDIPLYFKYPITRNHKISVQAGFSNLITFNQGAEQASSYTRQVAVYDALALNSFRVQSESVSQSQDLNVANQKFYPFATANLGVNIRLFEGKKTNYEVMPFYNYPLQEFSGYGEKLGMFGASFKVNFGAIRNK